MMCKFHYGTQMWIAMHQIIKERPKIGPVGRVPGTLWDTYILGRFIAEDEEEPLPVAPGAVFLLVPELVAMFEGPVNVGQLDPLVPLGTVTIFWFS